ASAIFGVISMVTLSLLVKDPHRESIKYPKQI
ncbi:MAG: hypothetical protein ACYDH1_18810, partial [Anaerolineaceae bacterium]